jgi:hypothetical protein
VAEKGGCRQISFIFLWMLWWVMGALRRKSNLCIPFLGIARPQSMDLFFFSSMSRLKCRHGGINIDLIVIVKKWLKEINLFYLCRWLQLAQLAKGKKSRP